MESVETKGRADQTSRVTIRPLVGIEDYEACIQLQRDTWGQEFTGCISRNVLMIVAQEAGGVLAGAFDERRLVGFVLGMAGIRDRKPIHWSQMLAVAPDYRGSGLGRTMKLYQRERVMLQGIDVMHWTFDPLEATNAHLNFNRLGVQADRYVENMYGTDNKSELAVLGTDRCVLRWELDSQLAKNVVAGHPRPEPEGARTAPVVNAPEDDGRPRLLSSDPPSGPLVRIVIPQHIGALKQDARDEALAWRETTRAAFRWYFDRQYHVTNFYCDAARELCYYVLGQEGCV